MIFLFLILFRSRYTKKKTMFLAGTGMGLLMLLNGVGLVVFGMETLGKVFVFTCSIPSFLFFYVLSEDRKFRFLLTFCLADTTCIWLMAATELLDHYLGGGRYILLFVSRIVAFPLLEYLAYRFLRKPYLELQTAVKKGWGIFAGMTVLYYVLLVVMVNYPTHIVTRPGEIPACVLVLALMFFNYATIFYSLYWQLLLYRKQQSERIWQEQKHSLELQLENRQRIRKMKHDMKGHTVTLSGLLAAGKTEEAAGYLKNVQSEMETAEGSICGNPYINAVIGQYVRKFKELETDFTAEVLIGEEELPYMELCQILSNGLENACDACKELAAQERKCSLQMKYNRDYLLIRIRNRCREDLQVEKGTIPATDREGTEHGFGLPTIKEAAERLDGDMYCYTENGNFVLDVMVRAEGREKTAHV